MNPLPSIRYILGGLVSPAKTFAPDRPPESYPIIQGTLWLLLAASVLLFLTALLFGLETTQIESGITVRTGEIKAFSIVAPVRRFVFPFYYIGYILLVFLIRHWMFFMLDESGRSFRLSLATAVLGTVPIIFAGVFTGVLNNLYPLIDPDESIALLMYARWILTVCVIGAAFLIEARVWVWVFHRTIGQPRRRALLTYLAPVQVLVLLAAGAILVGSL